MEPHIFGANGIGTLIYIYLVFTFFLLIFLIPFSGMICRSEKHHCGWTSSCVPTGSEASWIFQFNTHKFFLFLSVEWLVVDESDKLFEDGKTGFRDQLASIFLACTSHKVKRAMFSATFAYDVEQWCRLNLDNVITVSIGAR